MNCQNLILDAVDIALFWDVPEDALPGVVQSEASRLAGCNFD